MTTIQNNKAIITFFLILIIILFEITPLWAQADSTDVKKSNHCFHKGSMALSFQLGNSFSSGEETSYIFGFNYHIRNNSAIRFRGEGALNFGVDNSFADTLSPHDTTHYTHDYNFRYGYYGLSIQYILYKSINSHFNYYYGGGPSFTYRNPNNPHYIAEIYFSRTWDLGIAFPFGVQWFPTEKIAIMAEYGVKMQYREDFSKHKLSSKDGSYTRRIYKNGKFELKTLQFIFGIGIYF